jgi:hypothetical protein
MTAETLEQTSALAIAEPRDNAVMPGFNSESSWKLANRIGQAFAASSLVPQQYQGNVANCIVALEMANRMGASPLMVMQNLYIVHGNPGWSSKFLIACFNQCGRFSALRYEWNAERTACRAWAVEKATGERIDGPQVSVQMAKDEGWSTKNGSKWKTMPELMLMYRSAAYLIRTYAPEISMGLQTDDELIDVMPAPAAAQPAGSMAAVRAFLDAKAPALPPAATGNDSAGPLTMEPQTLAAYKLAIDNATDAETAALVLDQARDELDSTDNAALAEHFRSRWQEA